MLEFLVDELKSASLVGAAKVHKHLGKGARCCVLERKDRLLLVAHGEHGSPACTRARAGEELAGQSLNDLPLFGTRVLRLIDEHVIDALIELVVHPGGSVVAQQRKGFVDQIVVIEQSPAVL